jgi:tetratricopeptide (TPR) repeat protein
MRSIKFTAIALVALLALVSCSRNPEVAKQRYLESGNKYFANGKYKQARIMYKDAIQKDRLFGPAYYKLGLTAIKLASLNEAVGALRRAVELIKPDQPDHWDAMVKLSEIYILVGKGQNQKQYLDEVKVYADRMLQNDANSFDGHRLTADLHLANSLEKFRVNDKEEGAELLNLAIAEYNTANKIKPGEASVMIQLARAYASLSRFPEAEKLYRDVLAKDKTLQPAYTELYRIMLMQRRAEDGEQILKDALQAMPKQYGYLTMLAAHYASGGRTAEVAKVLEQIKSHAKEFDQAYLVVGDFYLRSGDGDSAIREYRDAISKDPKKATTYQKRIIEVYMRQGKRNEAADLNAQVLKTDPTDNDAKGLAASFLLDKGDINRALAELQAVVTRAPENPVARFNLGRAHAARNELEQARQMYQKAIELRPDYLQARLALAHLLVARGEFEAALKSSEQILQIDRNNLNARLVESAALMGMKKFGESRALLDSMLKANPISPDIYFQLGVVNLAENRFKDAEEAFRRAYQLNPANSRGLMGVVETSLVQGKADQALQLLRTESDKNPNRLQLRVEYGNTAVRAGRYDEAIVEYQKVLAAMDKESKARGEILVRIGETQRRKGDYSAAVATLQQARTIVPENHVALSTLALAFDQAGLYKEAKQVYEAALKLDSNNGYTLNNLAFLMAEHGGDLEDALTKAQRAKQIFPNLNEVSDTLGWIYLKKNMSDQAIGIFSELVTKAPDHSTFRYHLAMALRQKGDRTRAVKELQEALKKNPPQKEKSEIQAMLSQMGAG